MKVQIILSYTLAVALAWEPEPTKYYGPQHIPIIHNGVPLDTPAVQHARALHMAAVAEAKSRSGYGHEEQYYNTDDYSGGDDHEGSSYQPVYYSSYETAYAPQVGHDGHLMDTPEVQAAKAKHFAAVQKALSHGGHYRKRRSVESYIHYTTPMGLSHGLEDFDGHDYSYQAPVDTYEVQKARAQHLLAHAAAKQSDSSRYNINQIHVPVYGHHYSYETPAIGHDGQPLDTAEVQHAKAMHFAAYHQAAYRNSLGSHGFSGPVDTPEVQHARLQHLAAHAAVKAHQY